MLEQYKYKNAENRWKKLFLLPLVSDLQDTWGG
jgi:hypothetical protein